MSKETKKLYCYVDETGQDTVGRFFLVSVVVSGDNYEELKQNVEKIEKETNPGLSKWHKTAFKRKLAYLEKMLVNPLLKKSIFYSHYKDSKKYTDLTVLTTAKAILSNAPKDYRATVLVDGLRENETAYFAKGLRQLNINLKKVRGMREESDALLRLADNIAGFLRDAIENKPYAQELYKKAIKQGVIKELN